MNEYAYREYIIIEFILHKSSGKYLKLEVNLYFLLFILNRKGTLFGISIREALMLN